MIQLTRKQGDRIVFRILVVGMFISVALILGACGCPEASTLESYPSNETEEVPPLEPQLIEISVSPYTQVVKSGSIATVTITVRPQSHGVSSMDLILGFDPNMLEVRNVELGNFLGENPLVVLTKIDEQNGFVHLSAARVGQTIPPTEYGIFTTIQFDIPKGVDSGKTDLTISRVELANHNFENIDNFEVANASLQIVK